MSDPSPVPQREADGEPVLTLIRQIKENVVDPLLLTAEDRRRCVEVLYGEGYSVPEIAQILKRSERTIARDRLELRTANALRVPPQFGLQMAGELMRQAECSMNKLRRMARESSASVMERSMSENFAFKIYTEMFRLLQSMGYVPRIPTGVVTQVVGASAGDTIATYDQLAQRLKELDGIDDELGRRDPAIQAHLDKLKGLALRGRMAAEVDQLSHRSSPSEN